MPSSKKKIYIHTLNTLLNVDMRYVIYYGFVLFLYIEPHIVLFEVKPNFKTLRKRFLSIFTIIYHCFIHWDTYGVVLLPGSYDPSSDTYRPFSRVASHGMPGATSLVASCSNLRDCLEVAVGLWVMTRGRRFSFFFPCRK